MKQHQLILQSAWQYIAKSQQNTELNFLNQLQSLRNTFGFTMENSLSLMIGTTPN